MLLTAFRKTRFYRELHYAKLLFIMKLTVFFLLVACMQVSASGFSQKITFSAKNLPLEKVFRIIERQTSYVFFFDEDGMKKAQLVSANLRNASLAETLTQCFSNQPLSYTIMGNTIVVGWKNKDSTPSYKIPPPPLSYTIKGKVSDTDGKPLEGVSVALKGTGTGTTTAADGSYLIEVPDNSSGILIFSFVGMESRELPVKESAVFNVVLKPREEQQQEVVVVGYGTQKKVNLTGAISSVRSSDLKNRPVSNLSNALTGQLAGVTIIQNSGQPGADAGTIRVRGIGTLGNANAMVLVDGIESSLNSVDINDVESLTVLKDAAASAIYGVRAANGVILITTKKGKTGKPSLSYNFYAGRQKPTALPEFGSSADYAMLFNEAIHNDDPNVLPRYTEEAIQKFRDGSDPDHFPDSDWLDALLSGNGFLQNHYLNITGGSDMSRYYVSFGYNDREGLISNSKFNRYNFRVNLDNKISERLSFNLNLAASRDKAVEPSRGSAAIFQNNYREPPTIPIKFSDGTWGIYQNEHNSVAFAEEGGTNTAILNRLQGTLSASLKITKGLNLKGVASANYNAQENYNFTARQVFYDFDTKLPVSTKRSQAVNNDAKALEINLQTYLNYENSFGRHDLKGLLGYSQISGNQLSLSASRLDLPPNNQLQAIGTGILDGQTNNGGGFEYALQSVFGRLGYIFDERYLLEANFRYDGTSRFPKNNRFGFFPSFSAGWRISKESFFHSSVISDLKLRASWGKLGNQELLSPAGAPLYYPYQNTYVLNQNYTFGGNAGVIVQGVSINPVLSNPLITWETTSQSNFGIDAAAFRNSLSLSIDYFIKNTDGILLQFPAPEFLGVNPPTQNAGSVKNTGVEVMLSYRNTINKFNYYVNGNFSYVKNKITDLKGTDAPGRRVGDPVNNIFGLIAEGLFQSQEEIDKSPAQNIGTPGSNPGDVRYKDVNGDNIIDLNDRVSIGTYFPQISYGMQLGGSHNGLDLSLNFQGTGNVQGYLSRETSEAFFNGGKVLERHLDRWTPDNPDASYPRLSIANNTRNNQTSTYWMQDAAYLRLRNIQLGYSLPANVMSRLKINTIRVYISADNLLTLTKFDGYDPEAPFGTRGYYPQVKTITGGINVTF